MDTVVRTALEAWLLVGIGEVNDDALIELSIIINKEVKRRDLTL
jgi:hypothetical protein